MGGLPRILAIIGSGETSPTMNKVHRQLFDRLGPGPVPAAIIDTPFGFQANAEEVAAKTQRYFADAVGRPVEVARLSDSKDVGSLEYETAVARLRECAWIMSGPGSPSYALRNWRSTPVPDLLSSKLRSGGCLVFASAAAVTLGRVALPVYEIYKVGEPPHWLQGLDLLAELDLNAAVIPHFNNTEGGRHDTRYCYMGEQRLADLESQLPEGTFVLGVDEHTACLLDAGERSLTVAGNGSVWIRSRGMSHRLGAGTTVELTALRELAGGREGPPGGTGDRGPAAREADASTAQPGRDQGTPLEADTERLEQAFDAALVDGDAAGAAGAVLELVAVIEAWSNDTLESDELDRARSMLRTMIVRLGEAAVEGMREPTDVVGPYVEALLAARARARDEKRWQEADELRDGLIRAGVEVMDTSEGVRWRLR